MRLRPGLRSAPPDPLAGFKGAASRRGEGGRKEGRGREGRKREREERLRKGGDGPRWGSLQRSPRPPIAGFKGAASLRVGRGRREGRGREGGKRKGGGGEGQG